MSRVAPAAGLWIDAWLAGLDPRRDERVRELRDRIARAVANEDWISWRDFALLCHDLGDVACAQNPSTSYREIGSQLAEVVYADVELRAALEGSSLLTLLAENTRPALQSVFPDLRVAIELESSSGLELSLELPDPDVDCRAVLEIVHAFIAKAPTLLGLPEISVSAQYGQDGAHYALTSSDIPAEPFVGSDASAEYALDRSLPDSAPTDLSGWDSIHQLTAVSSQALSLEATAKAILEFLEEDFDYAHSQLWLEAQPGSGLSLIAGSQEAVKPPTRSLPLVTGGKVTGRIDLREPETLLFARPDSSTRLDRSEQLEELLPIIALILDNANARSQLASADPRAQPLAQLDDDFASGRDLVRQFRALAEQSGDALFEVGPAGVVYTSKGMRDMMGLHASFETTRTSPLDLVHPSSRDEIESVARSLLEQPGTARSTIRARRSDGRWLWLEASYLSLRTERGEIRVFVFCHDVSDSIRREEQREQMLSIVRNSLDLIALASFDGQLISLNAAGRSLVGLGSDSGTGSNSLFDLLTDEDAQSMRFSILPQVLRKRRWSGELHLQNFESHSSVPCTANLFVIDSGKRSEGGTIALICRDTSERTLAEEARIDSEQRNRILAENPYDLIAEVDAGGSFVYVSPNFRDILGYAPEDLLGRPAAVLVHEDSRREVGQGFRDLVSTVGSASSSFRVEHSDGSHRWLDGTARAYSTANGDILVVMIARDVTERKEAEDALRESESQLQQSQKMEAIGRLAGGVAHDFNNILTAIIGYADLLLDDLAPEHPVRSDAEEILKAAERASELTRQLLVFSRRQVLQPKRVDLNSLVAEIDRMLRRLLGEHIELVSDLDGELGSCEADPGQIQQVIMNLVVNAKDAMLRGGRISIETSSVVLGPEDLEAADNALPGPYVALSVSDTGEGMDPTTLEQAFEPFFTTKESGEGSGLGLSTVFGIVRQSGGHLRVSSNVGVGSRFTVYLPRIDSVEEIAEEEADFEAYRGSETILLVEDSEAVRLLIERYLKRSGYRVLEAATVDDAERIASQHDGPIHLLLTDVVLPKLGGTVLAARVLENRPEARVLYITGFTDGALRDYGVDSEEMNLLEKPFSSTHLLRSVRAVLDANALDESSHNRTLD